MSTLITGISSVAQSQASCSDHEASVTIKDKPRRTNVKRTPMKNSHIQPDSLQHVPQQNAPARPANHSYFQIQCPEPTPSSSSNPTHFPTPYFESERVTLYHGDAATIIARLAGSLKVNCIVTSPPYYGQRDYGVNDQLGLESHPKIYLEKLVTTFLYAFDLLVPEGSLWVVIGDTYWSGKGKPKGNDLKQRHRRFDRPQDRPGVGPWCIPKQQLLIPHRFAIAMQDLGWIVRNDNIWSKTSPMPDPAEDRCALTHEFVFHFVKQRRYYFDMKAVAVPSTGLRGTKPPASVWTIPTARSKKQHSAVFPEALVTLPINATCPDDGMLLDPFCGSGTTLLAALAKKPNCHVIGIDISEEALHEAQQLLAAYREK